MRALLICTSLATAASVLGWWVDQRILRCGSEFRAGLATGALFASCWLYSFVLVMRLVEVSPREGWLLGYLGVFMILVVFLSTVLATPVAIFVVVWDSPNARGRRAILPTASIVFALLSVHDWPSFLFPGV